MISLQWLIDAINERHLIQTDSKNSKPWFVNKLTDKPTLFEQIDYDAETQFAVLTGAWSIWCAVTPEHVPIVWRSRPTLIETRNEDRARAWRVEAWYGIGEEE